jgi:hypothetical protein
VRARGDGKLRPKADAVKFFGKKIFTERIRPFDESDLGSQGLLRGSEKLLKILNED